MLISVVIPVFRADAIIDELINRIETSISKITDQFEVILVEDCGPDRSWDKIVEIAQKKRFIKGIKLSRNFGQHYAITAGLDHAKGDWVVVMDCDLQDQPEEIEKLFNKALEGYDVVLSRRFDRKDSFLKRGFSFLFFKLLSFLTGTAFDNTVANFGVYNKKVIEAYCNMRESIRVFPIMIKWLGFKTYKLNTAHAARKHGKSSYNFKKLVNLAIDIILAFSDKPIRIVIKTGLIISMSAFAFATYNLLKYFDGTITVSGYSSLIISIWFLSGIILMTLGLIGLYVGKIFEGVKKRPIYVIDKTI